MIYYKNGFAQTSTIMPKIVLPEEERTYEWHLKMSQYIYSYHYNGWLWNMITNFPELRDYSNGMQSYGRYKPMLGIGDNFKVENSPQKQNSSADYMLQPPTEKGGNSHVKERASDNKGWRNIRFEKMLAPMPKMVDKVIGMLLSQEHEMEVSAIDKSSRRDKKNKKLELEVQMRERPFLEEINQKAGVELHKMPEIMPSTMEELDLLEGLGKFDLLFEKAQKKCIDATANGWTFGQDIKSIKRTVLRDLITLNCACVVDKIDMTKKIVEWEHIDMDNVILEYSKGSEKWDSSFWGYQKYYTVADLRLLNPDVPEETIREWALNYCNVNVLGNNVQASNLDLPSQYTNWGTCNYNDLKIPVLFYEVKCQDVEYDVEAGQQSVRHYIRKELVKKRELKAGKIKIDGNGEYYKERLAYNVEKGKLCVNYCGNWVIGTEYVFDYGKKLINTFDQISKDSTLSGHFYFLDGKSFVERGKEIADLWALAGYRLQNEIATAYPTNSYAYEYDSINNVAQILKTSTDGMIKKAQQSGRVVYKASPQVIPGMQNQYRYQIPIQKLEGTGLKEAIEEFELSMDSANKQLANLWGIDMVSSVSTQNKEGQAVGIQEQLQTSTGDITRKLTDGFLSMWDGLAVNTSIRVMLLAANSKDDKEYDCGYRNILTDEEWDSLVVSATPTKDRDLPAYMNVKTKAKLTAAEKAEILDTCKRMTAAGRNGQPSLKPAEYLMVVDKINHGGQIKEIAAYLSYKENKQAQIDAQTAQQNQEANSNAALAQEKAKQDGGERLLKIKYDYELRNIVEKERVAAIGKMMVEKHKNEQEINKKMVLSDPVQQELMGLMGMGQPQGAGQPQQPNQQSQTANV